MQHLCIIIFHFRPVTPAPLSLSLLHHESSDKRPVTDCLRFASCDRTREDAVVIDRARPSKFSLWALFCWVVPSTGAVDDSVVQADKIPQPPHHPSARPMKEQKLLSGIDMPSENLVLPALPPLHPM